MVDLYAAKLAAFQRGSSFFQMLLDDFDYALPPDLIAQQPTQKRDDSRLMVVNRTRKTLSTGQFPEILHHLHAGDVLVLNDTRVIPARLLGRKASGGRVEVFLSRRLPGGEEIWSCLTRSSKPIRSGTELQLGPGLVGTLLEGGESPHRLIRFEASDDFLQLLEKVGHVPLPPYIKREDSVADRERYQTVFARNAGAVAAPTAGLHFTEPLLMQLRNAGVEVVPLTLHVGLGTFMPVRSSNLLEHRMHSEFYRISETTAAAVNCARREGRRVIALGTTSTRALEAAADDQGELQAGVGETDIFITPGYRFRIIDGLITNFHLPKSTLLVLVSAFAGRDLILAAYQQAVAERFRFFSYGDCMLIHS